MDGKKLDLLTSLSPFFSDKNKILPFFDAIILGGSGDYVKMLTVVQHYNTKPLGSEDYDIHCDFTNFIIRTALKHKELDVTTRWSNLRFKIKEIHKLIESVFETPFVESQKEANIEADEADKTKFFNYFTFLENLIKLYNSREKISLYEKICLDIFISVWENRTKQNANMITSTENIAKTLGDCISKDNKICVRILDSIERKLTENNSENIRQLGNLTIKQRKYMMYFFYNTVSQLGAILIGKLFNKTVFANTPIDLSKFEQMSNDFNTIFEEYKAEFIDSVAKSFQNVYEEKYKKGTLIDKSNFVSKIFPQKEPSEVGKPVELEDAEKEEQEREKAASYKLLKNNSIHNHFVNTVIKNWYNLDKEAVRFYLENISIFEEYEDGWSDNLLLDELKMAELVKCLCSSNNKKLRVNLNKVAPNMTVFADKLPQFEPGIVKRAWLDPVTYVPMSKDIFKQIYMQTLMTTDGNITVNNVAYNISLIPTENNDPWDIDHVSSMKFYLKPLHLRDIDNKKNITAIDKYTVFDIDTDEIWYNDGINLYKIDENGKKVIYDAEKFNCTQRMGLQENKVNSNYCNDLAYCLITNPSKIDKCLKNIQNKMKKEASDKNDVPKLCDMFEFDEKDIQNMDPLMAKKLLEVFNIFMTKPVYDHDRKVQMVRPVSFEVWVENILNSDFMPEGWTENFKTALKGNGQLLLYIKALINFATNNPAILNPDKIINDPHVEDIKEDSQIKFLMKSGLNKFIEPNSMRSQLDIFGKQLDILTMKYKQSPYTNGVMGGGDLSKILNSNSPINMVGGGLHTHNYGSGISMYVTTAFKDLEASGVKFSNKSKEKIEQILAELNVLEKKSYEMVQVLMLLKRALNHANCYDDCNSDSQQQLTELLQEAELDFDSITSNKDFIKYLQNTIGEYKNCIHNMAGNIQNDNKTVITLLKNIINSANVNPVVIARKQ